LGKQGGTLGKQNLGVTCPTGKVEFKYFLSPEKGFFLKENIKLLWTIVVKESHDFTIAIFTLCHIVSAASSNTDIAGKNVTWRNQDKIKSVRGNMCA